MEAVSVSQYWEDDALLHLRLHRGRKQTGTLQIPGGHWLNIVKLLIN